MPLIWDAKHNLVKNNVAYRWHVFVYLRIPVFKSRLRTYTCVEVIDTIATMILFALHLNERVIIPYGHGFIHQKSLYAKQNK